MGACGVHSGGRAASSGGGEERSEKSDDSAYIENKSVEERVAQYNEIIAQQLHAHRLEKREEMFGSSSRSDDARAEPLYPPAYVPPPPRLPADDSVSHTPAAADIVLTRPGLSPIFTAVMASRRIFKRLRSYVIYRISVTVQVTPTLTRTLTLT